MAELRRRGVSDYLSNLVSSYFQDRKIQLAKRRELDITAGVPQGSVLGPLLWNILYDPLLSLKLVEGAKLVGFADDLAILLSASDRDTLIWNVNEALRDICKWMKTHHLQIAPEKTEAVILEGPRKRDGIVFRIGGREITPGKNIKYLGVILDDKGIFGAHI